MEIVTLLYLIFFVVNFTPDFFSDKYEQCEVLTSR